MNASVVIPVGPYPGNQRWLKQAVASVLEQTVLPFLVLIDDGAGLKPLQLGLFGQPFLHWQAPWQLGVAHAFNMGVALAPDRLVFMMGSDDVLEPTCIEECLNTYEQVRDNLGYYFVGVRYMDNGETQTTPCNAAMVTKDLWKHTGGLPLQSSSGAPDAALISILLAHGDKAGRLWPVADGKPLYNYRRHPGSDTASKGAWQRVILETRDLVTREWQPRD